MTNTPRSRAEEQFAAIQRKAERIKSENDLAQEERAERIAAQRAQRLAKEAADRAAAAEPAAGAKPARR